MKTLHFLLAFHLTIYFSTSILLALSPFLCYFPLEIATK
ncbi:hypothetical protein BCE_5029 [Bacillus cereus ATCC 10987]|uniref:Uncharacterized protein n=1 Tax=Bacillus cereus (strain ATCC 10987 / NRS 248) TaxID=222523 RepID=Q72YJ2_BACC1|nr:hypothetical protein BCE_5029 [Bacillus cereus ATCC 10987]